MKQQSWPKTIYLDIDNTLNNHYFANHQSEREFANWLSQACGIAADTVLQNYYAIKQAHPLLNFSSGLAARSARFEALRDTLILDSISTEALLENFSSLLLKNIRWAVGAKSALELFIASCEKLFLVSSSFSDIQKPLLEQMELPDGVKGIVYLNDLKLSKESGRAWAYMQEYSQGEPGRSSGASLVVGDNWLGDCVGASKAGIPHIWLDKLNTKQRKVHPYFLGRVSSLPEAANILDRNYWPVPYGRQPFVSIADSKQARNQRLQGATSEKVLSKLVASLNRELEKKFLRPIESQAQVYKIEFGAIIGSFARETYTHTISDIDIVLHTQQAPQDYSHKNVSLLTSQLLALLKKSRALEDYLNYFHFSAWEIYLKKPEFRQDRYWLCQFFVIKDDQERKICDLNIGQINNALAYESCINCWFETLAEEDALIIKDDIRRVKTLFRSFVDQYPVVVKVSGLFIEQLILQFGVSERCSVLNNADAAIAAMITSLEGVVKENKSVPDFFRPVGVGSFPNKKLVNFFAEFNRDELKELMLAFAFLRKEMQRQDQ